MPRIAVDARISRSWSTGVGVYMLRLLETLTELTSAHRFVFITARHAPPVPFAPARPVELRRAPYAPASLGQHLRLPALLRRFEIDALIVTHPASAPLWSPCPRLVFVHDLIPLALPHLYSAPKRLYYRTVVRWSLGRAARVLVDSESTRRDCERLLGLPGRALRVVYGGVDRRYLADSAPSTASERRPYILYLGNKRPHKSVDRLIEAFALLIHRSDPGCDLVIAGRDEPGDIETDGRRLRALAERLRLDGRVRFVGEVAEQELPALYRGAAAFVSLSEYEGFGLPPLEAMACGTPVLARNAGSLPEVVGPGGLLLESADPPLVAERLRAVLSDPALRRQLAQRARAQARRFSWEDTARAVLEEVEAALRGR